MGGGGRGAYRPDHNTAPNPEEKGQNGGSTGEYGAPRSMQEALRTVNPHFGEERAYEINCQRCVLAYEEQRKGLAVEAQPNRDKDLVKDGQLKNERGALWGILDYYPSGHEGLVNAYEGQTWEALPASRKAENAVSKLTKALESHGDGARFIVFVDWKNSNSSHVFNAEVVDGTAVFIDAQSNKVRDITSTLSSATLEGMWKPRYSRVDNLKLNDHVREWAFVDIK